MSNIGFKGIDIIQSGAEIVIRAWLTTMGLPLATGTTTVTILELQSDGTVKTFDFSTNTFVTTTVTTLTGSMSHQKCNNGAVNTGLWTLSLTTLTGFTIGAIYEYQVTNTSSDTPWQTTEKQYGGSDGDIGTTAISTGLGAIASNVVQIVGTGAQSSGGCLLANTLGRLAVSSVSGINVVGTSIPMTVDHSLNGSQAWVITGTGLGQVRTVVESIFSTKTFTVDHAFNPQVDNTSIIFFLAANGIKVDSSYQVTANAVNGNVTGSVGSISGITFPTNFPSISIDSSGRLLLQPTQTGVTIPTVTTTTNLTNAPTVGDFTATMKTSITTAATASTPTVTLATLQPNYAPALAGAQMDLIDAPNTTAITAFVTSIWGAILSGATSAGTMVSAIWSWISGNTKQTADVGVRITDDSIINDIDTKVTALAGGQGSGVAIVTLTVTDGTNPVQNAKVNLVINSSVYAGQTDVSGNITFNPNENAGTYQVLIAAGGYDGLTATLVVSSGTTTYTYALSQLSITPSNPPSVTGYMLLTDANNVSQSGVSVSIRMYTVPKGSTGAGFYGEITTVVSDGSGLVEFTGLVPGATYQIKRENGSWLLFVAGSSTFSIPSVIGLV